MQIEAMLLATRCQFALARKYCASYVYDMKTATPQQHLGHARSAAKRPQSANNQLFCADAWRDAVRLTEVPLRFLHKQLQSADAG